ncbi:hypothetical protein VTN77DRAFT_4889 [Rasamsonia byssochlamydoides]|uniref:uncharacterized protein n=1 Tax=Rasamsonia byssochlamydoides TaxID=89139 RepID=UPI0037430EAD
MPPDLNSLPPSRSTTSSPLQPRSWPSSFEGNNNNSNNTRSPSPRPSAAAADLSHRSSFNNHRSSPRRRRSGIGMHLNLNDPSGDLHSDHRSSLGHAFRTASPTSLGGSPIIATGDPHHQRAPSLGEIHQELEQEQEAQVNRLLQMIRQQQIQLQQLQQQQQQQQQSSNSGTAVVDDPTPNSERSASFASVPPLPVPGSRSIPLSLSTRRGSRTSSQATSPSLYPTGSAQPTSAIDPAHASYSSEWSGLGGGNESGIPTRRSSRDESAFYQAEAAMLSRENQMLRARIRELERQISELSTNQPSGVSASAEEITPAENPHPVDAGAAVSTLQADLADEAEKT